MPKGKVVSPEEAEITLTEKFGTEGWERSVIVTVHKNGGNGAFVNVWSSRSVDFQAAPMVYRLCDELSIDRKPDTKMIMTGAQLAFSALNSAPNADFADGYIARGLMAKATELLA